METVNKILAVAALTLTLGGFVFAVSVGNVPIALLQGLLFGLTAYRAITNKTFTKT